MKVDIVLKNNSICDGCPLMQVSCCSNDYCSLGYWRIDDNIEQFNIKRPQKCIEEHGY